jgi:hypothetical protein
MYLQLLSTQRVQLCTLLACWVHLLLREDRSVPVGTGGKGAGTCVLAKLLQPPIITIS